MSRTWWGGDGAGWVPAWWVLWSYQPLPPPHGPCWWIWGGFGPMFGAEVGSQTTAGSGMSPGSSGAPKHPPAAPAHTAWLPSPRAIPNAAGSRREPGPAGNPPPPPAPTGSAAPSHPHGQKVAVLRRTCSKAPVRRPGLRGFPAKAAGDGSTPAPQISPPQPQALGTEPSLSPLPSRGCPSWHPAPAGLTPAGINLIFLAGL